MTPKCSRLRSGVHQLPGCSRNRKYDDATIAEIKHHYLSLWVLGYYTQKQCLEMVAEAVGLTFGQVQGLVQVYLRA